ncbi:MAG: lipoyl(octanoyl) transferase LipB [Candidatus Midichloria sp.]|nr:MAG: lipoyl(octanoyl) transferase LipB [Candidatus Midichloria sp.]
MTSIVDQILNKQHNSVLWFLEHDHLYTAGASANSSDLIINPQAPIFTTDRGGKYTYHGPGQLIVYMMLNLKALYHNQLDIKKFVADVCKWLTISLEELGVACIADKENIGIWCFDRNQNKKKIVSIGFKLKKWVTYHGVAINISPELLRFNFIKPCGLSSHSISSLESLEYNISITKLHSILIKNFLIMFNIND